MRSGGPLSRIARGTRELGKRGRNGEKAEQKRRGGGGDRRCGGEEGGTQRRRRERGEEEEEQEPQHGDDGRGARGAARRRAQRDGLGAISSSGARVAASRRSPGSRGATPECGPRAQREIGATAGEPSRQARQDKSRGRKSAAENAGRSRGLAGEERKAGGGFLQCVIERGRGRRAVGKSGGWRQGGQGVPRTRRRHTQKAREGGEAGAKRR